MPGLESFLGAAGGPIALGLGAVNAVPSFIAAIKQKQQAKKLKLEDTTPAAFREQLALSRQGVNTTLPGMGMQQLRLAQAQQAAGNTLTRGGASSSAILGGLAALAQRRQAGEENLALQGQQYRLGQQGQLRRDLSTQADYQTNDLNNFRKQKAALIQSSNENLSRGLGALTGGAASAVNIASMNTRGADTLAGSTAGLESLASRPASLTVPRMNSTPPAILPRYTGAKSYNALGNLQRRGIPYASSY